MKKRQRLRRALLLVSFLLFPITINYYSPYLILQGSMEGVLAGSALLFGGQFLFAIFFGRLFCGWLCPAGALQEACATIVEKPVKKRADIVKYIIWAPWLGSIIAGFVFAGGVKRVDPLYYTEGGISVNSPEGYIIYFGVIFLLVLLAFTVGRRGACHSVCWMAPFMVLGGRMGRALCLPALRMKPEKEKCTSCKACEKACPMSLPVSSMAARGDMKHTECILCANCADACPRHVITMGFQTASKAATKAAKQSAAGSR
ncbi:MAG TPA: 4Fe-4S binding protein [Feifaniaceae bacterium]|nr:4Fe-4S binding protein [Feifaniaceae bacterium]